MSRRRLPAVAQPAVLLGLVTHELIGGPMAATLPSPPVLIVAIYGTACTLFGTLGATLRRRFTPAV